MLRVSGLFRYPVKSLAGWSEETLELDELGVVGDRHWMLVDELGMFVTQRKHACLSQIIVREQGRQLELFLPDGQSLVFLAGQESMSVGVWRDTVSAVVGEGPDHRLSDWLGVPVAPVYMENPRARRVDPAYVSAERHVSFADGFPLLVVNEASLAQVESWCGRSISMRRFRPNIVIQGAEPFAEDGWRRLRIGQVAFELVKPCSRCVMTTIDPDTGLRDEDGNPLKVLTLHRKMSDGVIFGQNALHLSTGRISLGDTVELLA